MAEHYVVKKQTTKTGQDVSTTYEIFTCASVVKRTSHYGAFLTVIFHTSKPELSYKPASVDSRPEIRLNPRLNVDAPFAYLTSEHQIAPGFAT